MSFSDQRMKVASEIFNNADRRQFLIDDPRERADALRNLLVPRIKSIYRLAFSRLQQVSKLSPDEGSSPNPSISPDHRKDATKTKDFFAAYVGLVGKQVGGKYISPKLIYLLDRDGLRTLLWINKSREAGVFDELLTRHETSIDNLLSVMDQPQRWLQGGGASSVRSNLLKSLPTARIYGLEHFSHVGLCGKVHPYPISVGQVIDSLLCDFITLFPIYKTLVDWLHGDEGRLEELYGRFEAWHRKQSPDLTLPEGEREKLLVSHRKREKRLREAKIQDALSKGSGRLACEVPDCGFDFLDVYGELGREYAEVHHLDPLGVREAPSETSLDRLAIVCANCHAMIHRGGESRPLEGLIQISRFLA